MHLKNFSLYRPKEHYQLTPAYDLLNVAIANPKDKEELALSLNGKKSRLKRKDFLKASETMGVDVRVTLQLIENMSKALPMWKRMIENSFLGDGQKKAYMELIVRRLYLLWKSRNMLLLSKSENHLDDLCL